MASEERERYGKEDNLTSPILDKLLTYDSVEEACTAHGFTKQLSFEYRYINAELNMLFRYVNRHSKSTLKNSGQLTTSRYVTPLYGISLVPGHI